MTEKWRLFAVAGLLATALYVLDVSPEVNGLCALATGVGTVWSCYTAPRRGAGPRRAWTLMGSGALCFLLGMVIRPLVLDLSMPWLLLADAATMPGYVLLTLSLLALLRARDSIERHSVLDGAIVCLAGTMTAILVFALPAATVPGRTVVESALAGLYPLLDVVVAVLVVNLTFTARAWPPAMIGFLGVMTFMFIGDSAYAFIGISGQLYASPLLDLPFLLAFTLLGVTALHPSAAELSRAARRPVQAWSRRRIAVLAPALAAPFVLLLVLDELDRVERLTVALGGALTVAMLLARAVSAVAAQVAAQRRTEHQARHDQLTGLPNRRKITEEIDLMLCRARGAGRTRQVWVYLLDLDGFKYVNESWGHATGDRLVIEVGRRLRAEVAAEVAVAALGGDEFLLAYAGGRDNAMAVADAIRDCFARPFPVGTADLTISASVGIACSPEGAGAAGTQGEVSAAALLRDADTALYRAKDEGPGRSTVFDASMLDQVRERIEMEVALRRALGADELHVAYQPIVRLADGQPIGAEALVRWTHPVSGPISPAVFIPLAEKAGLITEIGTWVRQEALRQLGAWRADGTVTDDFYLSINVSPYQLGDSALPAEVAAELRTAGVPARCVALEMTETVKVDGSTVTGRVLLELRELGLRLLIDDFGTGFSALSYLRRFPVTGIKIDRSFVIDMGRNREDDEIAGAVVSLGRALGLSVIAEGVETRVQRDALAAVGVVHGQGWLWGPAVPPAEFAAHWRPTSTVSLTGSLNRD